MKTIITAMLFCITLAFTSCSDDDTRPPKTFVLVAGSWQGAWVWKDVKTRLENAGHRVIAVELPAHGKDNTAHKDVSMNVYRDKVVSEINKVPGKVILVGHSMAGIVISIVSEKIPEKIEKTIYIGAMLPADGQSLLDLSSTDPESLLTPSIIPSEDLLSLDVIHENITNIFCQDGSVAVKQSILDNFKLEPAIPFTDHVALTEANFGKTKKFYIHTELDHAITIKLQKKMVATAGVTNVYSLKSSHSPQLSMPDKVAALLIQLCDQ